MLSLEDAIGKMNEYIKTANGMTPTEWVLILDATIEFEYGWAFFYQSRKYVETGDIMDAYVGHGAVIINKYDGDLYTTGSAHPAEKYIEDYVKRMREGNA